MKVLTNLFKGYSVEHVSPVTRKYYFEYER
jgi:hypothetical protein